MREHEHGQQCGDCRGKEGIKGNGKNTIKMFKKKMREEATFPSTDRCRSNWLPIQHPLSCLLPKRVLLLFRS